MLVLVRGVGDIGSAVAHCLFRLGYGAVIHDDPRPTSTRRGMAFADAVFDGDTALDQVRAVRVNGAGTCGLAHAPRLDEMFLSTPRARLKRRRGAGPQSVVFLVPRTRSGPRRAWRRFSPGDQRAAGTRRDLDGGLAAVLAGAAAVDSARGDDHV